MGGWVGGWVGAGLIKIKTNSAFKLSLSWGLALAELDNNFGIQLDTGSEVIQPSDNERLLGAQIPNNLTWNSHISEGDTSIFNIKETSLLVRENQNRLQLSNKASYWKLFESQQTPKSGTAKESFVHRSTVLLEKRRAFI